MPNSKQRREAERRRLQRQVQRRARRAAGRRRVMITVSVVAVLAVIGIVVGFIVASNSDHSAPPAANPTSPHPLPTTSAPTTGAPTTGAPTTSAPAGGGNCTYTASGAAAKKVSLPPSKQPATGTVKATVATSQGSLTFTLDRAHTPCTVGSFVSLAKQKYFDSTPCHRLTTSGIYVLQCGDPTGSGSGGPGYKFNDELTGKEKYTRGVLAMANAGANTNGSQFFIVYKNSQLGPNYTVFGKVTKGLGVVDKVAAQGVQGGGSDGKPALPVTIKHVTIGS